MARAPNWVTCIETEMRAVAYIHIHTCIDLPLSRVLRSVYRWPSSPLRPSLEHYTRILVEFRVLNFRMYACVSGLSLFIWRVFCIHCINELLPSSPTRPSLEHYTLELNHVSGVNLNMNLLISLSPSLPCSVSFSLLSLSLILHENHANSQEESIVMVVLPTGILGYSHPQICRARQMMLGLAVIRRMSLCKSTCQCQ